MRRNALLPFGLVGVVILAGCGGADGSAAPTSSAPSADVGEASEVTPLDDATVAAAREEGEVLLYTSAEDQQMAPIKAAFEEAFPEITLRSLALGDDEMFQRYETEVATGSPTADVMMNADAVAWLDFMDGGNIDESEDPNAPNLPDYALLGPGVYAVSVDPVVAVFNKALLPEDQQPTTMAELAEMAPELDGRVATADIGNAVSFGATAAFTEAYGEDGWAILEEIGPHASVEASNGPLITKTAQGQYTANFFVAGAVRAFIVDDVAQVVNYRYLDDGTPLNPRAVGVTAEAPHSNAGKVFLNWLLSVEGQEAACQGGFTPYRDGVECEFGLPQVIEAIGGEENLTIGSYDREVVERQAEIVQRWNEAFGR